MARVLGRGVFLLTTAALLFVTAQFRDLISTAPFMPPKLEEERCDAGNDDFDWDKLPSRSKLAWVRCHDQFECAKLSVSLNYSDPAGRKASIALIRLPALVNRGSLEYQGPILFNPGGPGGSGVDYLLRQGDIFRTIIGGKFDLVGFDPRGVSRSKPNAEIFNSAAERAQWVQPRQPLYTTNGRLAKFLAYINVTNTLARERDHGKDVLAHINTENTVVDMLRIVQAHGREKLLYWGASYGTVLGSAFASMFPDKVERMIIDAVVDMEDYFSGVGEASLRDTDAAWAQFASGCFKAGPAGCALYSSTLRGITDRVTAISRQVNIRPVPVRSDSQYGIVDYDVVREAIFASLYKPYALFPKLAQGLAELEEGDGTKILEMTQKPRFECPSCSAPRIGRSRQSEAGTTILCNDAQVPSNSTFEYAEGHLKRLLDTSQFGHMWADIELSCNGWPKFPKGFGGPVGGNTSFPLLIIGNTADPVTPLRSAKKVSLAFPNSVVLTQNSPGHSALASVSACTLKYIGEYFRNGTLPPANTVCEVDIELFPSDQATRLDREDLVQTVLEDEDIRMEKLKRLIRERWRTMEHRYSLPLAPMF